ncbi:MAG TPA: sulfatase-like hydrolase/transferase [Bryobacteraceae bacterium]|nr:sulfatase-like hydrolase/transferase [Bryobacteraceae bacterium]
MRSRSSAKNASVVAAAFAAIAFSLFVSCQSSGRKATPAGGSASQLRRVNVVLVTIDTLRADRLGCYGYAKVETPNLDRLAQRGTLFENAVAQAPLTAPSHASMFTGVYPTVHKVRDTGGFVLARTETTLAEMLQQQGWETAAFVGSSVLKKRFGFDQGFAVYDDDMASGTAGPDGPERPASVVVDRAIQWLQERGSNPYFLWAHVYDPHLPYQPPAPFREKYKGNLYDGEIAYTDQQLGRLFDAVAKKSPDNTLIAVLSDHGESFSEHGEYAHGVFLYDSTLRIPFILAGAGVPAGLRVKQQVRSIDLLPTVLGLLGGTPGQRVQGTTLGPAFKGKPVRTGHSYAETLFPRINMGWSELRGMRTDRWMYIRAPRPELYDLVQDPGQTANVIDKHAKDADELEAELKTVIGNNGNEVVRTTALDQQTRDQLKSLGYLSGSSQGEFGLTGKGADPKDRIEILRLLHFAEYSGQPIAPARSIAMLRQAISKDPANPSLYSNLGDILRREGRRAEEMELYDAAVKRGVQTAWLYSRLGALHLRRGEKREAIGLFEAAAKLNPSDYESLQNLAAAYRDTGRIADAERVLTSILASGEEYAPAYNELGMAAFQKGDAATARSYFEKAGRLDLQYQLNVCRIYRIAGEADRARGCFDALKAAIGSRAEYRQLVPLVNQELAALR